MLAAFTPSSRAVEPSVALSTSLRHALAAKDVDSTRTAALAIDLRSGEVVYGQNDSLALAPASSEKLAVTLAALRDLGPSYRFRTQVAGRGRAVGHVWEGNLFLVGSGDPTLDVRDVDALARKVAARGISTGRRTRPRRRAPLRHRARRAGLEALLPRDRVGAPLGSFGPRRDAPDHEQLGLRGRSGVPERPGPPRRRGDRRRRERPRAARRTAARVPPLGAALRRRPRDEPRERQLRRGDAAQGARSDDGGTRLDGGGAARRPRRPRRGRRSRSKESRLADASGLSLRDRLTVRALVAILESGSTDPAIRRRLRLLPLGRGGVRDAPAPPREAADPRPRAGEDGDDERGLRPRRLRRQEIRLRDPAERLAGRLLVCTGRAGPLRDRARPPLRRLREERAEVGLREDGNAELLRLLELRARALSGDDARGLPRDGVGHLRPERLERGLRLLSRPRLERPGDHVLASAERPLDRPFRLARLHLQPERPKLLDERAVLLVREPLGDELGPVGADPLHPGQLLRRRAHERVDGAEMAREVSCHDPADLRDVQAEEHAVEGLRLRRLDRVDRVPRGDLAVAVELGELLRREPVQVRHRPEKALVPELPHELLADALDVHRGLHPVDERLEATRRARPVRAAVHDLALRLHDLRAAERAVLRHPERPRARRVREHGTDHLRDHVAGALDDHGVSLADVLPPDVVLVVERRARDRHPADLHGLELRPGVQGARATDPDVHLQELRLGSHRRPLERARPARTPMKSSQPPLLVE